MKDESVGGVHWSFWIIGAVALIWNVMGVINFFGQMNADALAAMPKAQRAIIEGRPAWATGAFAIAVFGGALGSLVRSSGSKAWQRKGSGELSSWRTSARPGRTCHHCVVWNSPRPLNFRDLRRFSRRERASSAPLGQSRRCADGEGSRALLEATRYRES